MKVRIALLILMIPSALSAQPAAAPPPPKREVKAEFALVATTGNAPTQSIGAAGEVTYRPDPWIVTAKAGFIRNEANDVVSAKSFRTLERAAQVITPRLQGFGQHAYLRDLFSGVVQRHSLDGGLSYLVFQTTRQSLFADGGLGYLNEQRTVGRDLSTGIATGGGRYKVKISETSDFTDDLLVSADFAKDGTWRLAQTAALTAKIATLFSLKLSHIVRFVDVPVPGFKRTDTVTSAALVVSF